MNMRRAKWRDDVGELAQVINRPFVRLTDGRTRVVMAPDLKTECIRLPRGRELDPVFGLSRSYLNTLILPSRRSGGRVLVRSFRLLRPGNKKGLRLIDLQSLRDYIHSRMVASEPQEPIEVPVARQLEEELKLV